MMPLTLLAGKQKNTMVSDAPTTMITEGMSMYIPRLPPEPENSAQATSAHVPRNPKSRPRSMTDRPAPDPRGRDTVLSAEARRCVEKVSAVLVGRRHDLRGR